MNLSHIVTALTTLTAVASRSAIATLIAATVTVPALAEGTPQQRRACTPDVMRLCKAEIPDHARITACLIAKRSSLSEACAMVMFPSRHSERASRDSALTRRS